MSREAQRKIKRKRKRRKRTEKKKKKRIVNEERMTAKLGNGLTRGGRGWCGEGARSESGRKRKGEVIQYSEA